MANPTSKKTAVVVRAETLDEKSLAERRGQLAVMHQEHNAVLQQFGDGQPYVRDHYVTDCKYYAHRAWESALLLGKRLIVMKAFEPHGEWLPLLEQIGVDARFAQKAMLAARRLAGMPEPAARNLISAAGNQRKIFDLLGLSEDELATLAAGGDDNLSLDDVERMSSAELRRALRKSREEADKAIRQNEEAEKEIIKLADERTRARREWSRKPPDEQELKLREAVTRAQTDIRAAIGFSETEPRGLTAAVLALLNSSKETGDQTDFISGVFHALINEIGRVRDSLPVNIPILKSGR